MLFPVIKIKTQHGDRESIHIVGTNSHDCLIIQGNAIHYLNIQSMVGTRHPKESGMYFVEAESDEYDLCPYAEVEMVTIEELIAIAEQNMRDQTEASLKMHEAMEKYLAAKAECEEKRKDDDIRDTSGMLF